MGPREHNNTNAPIPPNDRRNVLQSEMNNPAIEPVARMYSELRYQLMPYTYTLAYEARTSGLPLMRAMWLHYPHDAAARSLADQYLWGRDMLIAPVYEKGATSRSVYLPEGIWYDWWNDDQLVGGKRVDRPVDLATLPIYVRAGGVIPLDPVRQHTGEPASGPTIIRVYRGAEGSFTLYDDDGISQDYLRRRGSWIHFRWAETPRILTISPDPPSGATNLPVNRQFTVVMLPDNWRQTVTYSGRTIRIQVPPSTR
jgi:alpha-glucosidase/alpha-D-xyloside xylohydrolase